MTKKRKENALLAKNDKIQVGRDREEGAYCSPHRSLTSNLTSGDEHLRAEGPTAGRGGQTEPAGGESHGED